MSDEWIKVDQIIGCRPERIEVCNSDGEVIALMGTWYGATCREFTVAIEAAGGYDNLRVFGSYTSETECYTCWGHTDARTPVAAHGGPIEHGHTDCRHQHAVFFWTPPEKAEFAIDGWRSEWDAILQRSQDRRKPKGGA